jgi:hypothetical protein
MRTAARKQSPELPRIMGGRRSIRERLDLKARIERQGKTAEIIHGNGGNSQAERDAFA